MLPLFRAVVTFLLLSDKATPSVLKNTLRKLQGSKPHKMNNTVFLPARGLLNSFFGFLHGGLFETGALKLFPVVSNIPFQIILPIGYIHKGLLFHL